MSSIESEIRSRVLESLNPTYFEIVNESHQHSVPANSETHFKVLIVSEKFVGASRVQRQRTVNALVQPLFERGLHAFTQRLLTPEEWEQQKEKMQFESPNCLGGSKKDMGS